MSYLALLDKAKSLAKYHDLSDEGLLSILSNKDKDIDSFLRETAQKQCQSVYGKKVFIRGLIEFTNYCKNDCYYCGIRNGNRNIERYRLGEEQILSCCEEGYSLGFRTFVLQGGEDPWFHDDRLCRIISSIKSKFPDCAVTLSVGERSYDSFKRLYDAGADRYLLRHETATKEHYEHLHPQNLKLENRLQCLKFLREIGYQTGCGFMVGSPFQMPEDIVRDLRFIKEFRPHMVGIGPFLSQKDTPFKDYPNGSGRTYTAFAFYHQADAPRSSAPCNNRFGHAYAKWARAGHPSWRERRNA